MKITGLLDNSSKKYFNESIKKLITLSGVHMQTAAWYTEHSPLEGKYKTNFVQLCQARLIVLTCFMNS